MSFTVDTTIRGHHIYKEIWTPVIGEELTCAIEDGNEWDPYAVAIIKIGTVAGHVQRHISAACNLFLDQGGTILCTVTGPRIYLPVIYLKVD